MWNKFRKYQPDEIFTRRGIMVDVGESFLFDVFLFDSVGDTDPDPLDITTMTIEFSAVDDLLNPVLTIDKTVGEGITVMDPLTGQVRVELTPTDTMILGPFGGKLFYEVSATGDPGTTEIALHGNLILRSNAS